MLISKAMDELTTDLLETGERKSKPLRAAQRLGFQALKFRQRWEQQEGDDDFPLLPGETRERIQRP